MDCCKEIIYYNVLSLNYLLDLYTFENMNNEILFTDYYIKVNNVWIMLLDENKKYYDINQNINDMKNEFKYSIKNENENENKNETKTNIKTKKKSIKYKKLMEKSRKISKKLSKIINKL